MLKKIIKIFCIFLITTHLISEKITDEILLKLSSQDKEVLLGSERSSKSYFGKKYKTWGLTVKDYPELINKIRQESVSPSPALSSALKESQTRVLETQREIAETKQKIAEEKKRREEAEQRAVESEKKVVELQAKISDTPQKIQNNLSSLESTASEMDGILQQLSNTSATDLRSIEIKTGTLEELFATIEFLEKLLEKLKNLVTEILKTEILKTLTKEEAQNLENFLAFIGTSTSRYLQISIDELNKLISEVSFKEYYINESFEAELSQMLPDQKSQFVKEKIQEVFGTSLKRLLILKTMTTGKIKDLSNKIEKAQLFIENFDTTFNNFKISTIKNFLLKYNIYTIPLLFKKILDQSNSEKLFEYLQKYLSMNRIIQTDDIIPKEISIDILNLHQKEILNLLKTSSSKDISQLYYRLLEGFIEISENKGNAQKSLAKSQPDTPDYKKWQQVIQNRNNEISCFKKFANTLSENNIPKPEEITLNYNQISKISDMNDRNWLTAFFNIKFEEAIKEDIKKVAPPPPSISGPPLPPPPPAPGQPTIIKAPPKIAAGALEEMRKKLEEKRKAKEAEKAQP